MDVDMGNINRAPTAVEITINSPVEEIPANGAGEATHGAANRGSSRTEASSNGAAKKSYTALRMKAYGPPTSLYIRRKRKSVGEQKKLPTSQLYLEKKKDEFMEQMMYWWRQMGKNKLTKIF